MKKSLYDVLQVSQSADMEIIEIAYQSKKTKLQNATDPDSHIALKALEMAYEVLGNKARRVEYDKKLTMQDHGQANKPPLVAESEYKSEFSSNLLDWWDSRKLMMVLIIVTILVGVNYFLSYQQDKHKSDLIKEAARLDAINASRRIDNETKLVSGSVDAASQHDERRNQELELRARVESERLEIERQRLEMERERRQLQEFRSQEHEEARKAENEKAEEKRRIDRELAYYQCVNRKTGALGFSKAAASCTR